MKMKNLIYGLGILLAGLMVGCNNNPDNLDQDPSGPGKVILKITDAPFPAELVAEANVTIDWVQLGKIEPTEDGEKTDDQFYTIELVEETTFNLLELSNGISEVLGEAEVPAGEYDEIRMHVTSASIVLTDGTEYDMKVPGGSSSGLKVKVIPAILVDNGTPSEILLDFDVSRSFVAKGNYNAKKGINNIKGFNFKPVVRAVNTAVSGKIYGLVTELEGEVIKNAFVYLLSDEDTITSAKTDKNGYYAITGIPEGSYSLTCVKEDYEDKSVGDVEIVAGSESEFNFELVKVEETEENTEETNDNSEETSGE